MLTKNQKVKIVKEFGKNKSEFLNKKLKWPNKLYSHIFKSLNKIETQMKTSLKNITQSIVL